MILNETLENRKNDSKKTRTIQKVKITTEVNAAAIKLNNVSYEQQKSKFADQNMVTIEKIKTIDFDNMLSCSQYNFIESRQI